MKFPNAAKGVKKIFNAEIISLIAALIGGAGLVMSLIGASNETDESAGTTLLAVSGALLIVSGIALLVAGIMNIIGFIQAAKDEKGIKRAVLCTVFSLRSLPRSLRIRPASSADLAPFYRRLPLC